MAKVATIGGGSSSCSSSRGRVPRRPLDATEILKDDTFVREQEALERAAQSLIDCEKAYVKQLSDIKDGKQHRGSLEAIEESAERSLVLVDSIQVGASSNKFLKNRKLEISTRFTKLLSYIETLLQSSPLESVKGKPEAPRESVKVKLEDQVTVRVPKRKFAGFAGLERRRRLNATMLAHDKSNSYEFTCTVQNLVTLGLFSDAALTRKQRVGGVDAADSRGASCERGPCHKYF